MRRGLLLLALLWCGVAAAAPLVDHHQHLFSPAAVARTPGLTKVDGADLVRLLDEAGIERAVVLSTAYQLGNPNRPAVADEYTRVREENDWTAQQVAEHAERLVGFCGFNPLRDYALTELERCAHIPALATGIKLHFGNSDVDLDNPAHVSSLRRVFAAANARRMAIIVHLHPSVTMKRPYGVRQARVFLEQLLPAAPGVTVQIAHLCGAGSYDPESDAALGVFAQAVGRRDPRLRKVYFDISGVTGLGDWRGYAPTIVRRLRAIGLERVLYGSDGAPDAESTPAKRYSSLRELPLTPGELRTLERNVAPYLKTAPRLPPVPRKEAPDIGAPQVDHHQHLLNAEMVAQGQKPIDARAMIAMLDDARIARAVLLSNAFRYGNPSEAPRPDEYARVIAENDWTANEAARYATRLVALCSFNPLKAYALDELKRCARDRRFGRGIKLQLGYSDVDLDDPVEVAMLRRVFRVANANGMAVVVHMRPRRARNFGAAEAQLFLDELLAAAPDVPVQIAHFCGGGAPDDAAADQALAVFTAAIARQDPRVRNLYFDLALVIDAAMDPVRKAAVVQRIREIGVNRILYGTDGGDPTDPPPKTQVQVLHSLPLTPAEIRTIESNVAPYLR
ncbi:MAG TPA: amidohydrolase family protein [Steroidobacteraceae bacterium]